MAFHHQSGKCEANEVGTETDGQAQTDWDQSPQVCRTASLVELIPKVDWPTDRVNTFTPRHRERRLRLVLLAGSSK